MPRDQSSASRLVRNVFALVGHPVLRMTAFHVPEGVLIMVATVLPVQCSRFATVPRLYRKNQNEHKGTKEIESVSIQNVAIYFIFLCLLCVILVGPEGFEPPTKGL